MTEIRKHKRLDGADISRLIEPENGRGHDAAGSGNSPSAPAVPVKRTNIPMVIMIFVMLVFGFIVLYSVSGPDAYGKYQDSAYFLRKQVVFTLIGLAGCFAASFFPIKIFKLKGFMLLTYGMSFVLAVITLAFGSGAQEHGATRWISIGGFQFQTSEVIKVALILAFAGYRSMIDGMHRNGKLKAKTKSRQALMDTTFDFLIPVVAAVAVDLVIVLQPHVSCFIIIGIVIFMCALSSEIPLRSWVMGTAILVIAAIVFALAAFMLAPSDKRDSFMKNYAHVFKRFEIFNADESGTDENTTITEDDTRQVDNAFNALGSGGMWGVGLGNSRSKYNYVSEAQNDYIFSIYVEETGFVGGVVLIMLYLVMLVMCLNVIWRADGIYMRTIATGCTTLIFIEVFLNMAVELQVIPSTGVTLPFVSYGGTAQIFLLLAYGLIMAVSRSGTRPAAPKKDQRKR